MDGLQPGDPGMVGRYRLVGRLGEGGMGRVFLGMSPGGRQVAVKLIHPGQVGRHFRERFAREIAAARQVGGFHTAPVVDADPDADPPWMVTAYIHGPSLEDAVIERGPLSIDALRLLGAGLAEGLAAIHSCGLVHRDLKPSNVILADDGPRIIDFGIARAAEDSGMTTAGVVVGTIAYMSPEQVRGEQVGPASDVFSLGCTLAFAATARTPFGEGSIVTVATRITGAPPDLAGVTDEHGFRQLLADCLAKDPGDRPPLPEILARLTTIVPDDAAVRGPGYTAKTKPITDAPVAPLAGPNRPASGSGDEGPWYLRTDRMAKGGSVVPADPTTDSGRPVPDLPPRYEPEPPLRYEPQPPRYEPQPPRYEPEPPPPRYEPGYQPDPGSGRRPTRERGRPGSGRRVLIGAGAGVVVLVAVVLAIVLSSSSPGKTSLAGKSPSPHPTVHRSNIPVPIGTPPTRPVATLHDPDGKTVFSAVFNSDSMLAVGGLGGNVYQWNVTGSLSATLTDPASKGIGDVAFNQATDSLAAADGNGSAYVFNAATGKLTATLTDPGSKGVYGVAFSPNGGSVAAADDNGDTYLWKVATKDVTTVLTDPSSTGVYDVSWSPDGSLLATGDYNGSTYLWKVATGKLVATLKDPHSKGVYSVSFNPGGTLVAAADQNGSTYLWKVPSGTLSASLEPSGNVGGNGHPAFSPNGGFLAVANGDGDTYVWDVSTSKLLATFADPATKGVNGTAFSPDGSFLATTDHNGSTYLWNMSWLGS
jgi:serine/threonine protein kinase/WD40 repeat protein